MLSSELHCEAYYTAGAVKCLREVQCDSVCKICIYIYIYMFFLIVAARFKGVSRHHDEGSCQ